MNAKCSPSSGVQVVKYSKSIQSISQEIGTQEHTLVDSLSFSIICHGFPLGSYKEAHSILCYTISRAGCFIKHKYERA